MKSVNASTLGRTRKFEVKFYPLGGYPSREIFKNNKAEEDKMANIRVSLQEYDI